MLPHFEAWRNKFLLFLFYFCTVISKRIQKYVRQEGNITRLLRAKFFECLFIFISLSSSGFVNISFVQLFFFFFLILKWVFCLVSILCASKSRSSCYRLIRSWQCNPVQNLFKYHLIRIICGQFKKKNRKKQHILSVSRVSQI